MLSGHSRQAREGRVKKRDGREGSSREGRSSGGCVGSTSCLAVALALVRGRGDEQQREDGGEDQDPRRLRRQSEVIRAI